MGKNSDEELDRIKANFRRRTVSGQAIDFLNELSRERREAERRDRQDKKEKR